MVLAVVRLVLVAVLLVEPARLTKVLVAELAVVESLSHPEVAVVAQGRLVLTLKLLQVVAVRVATVSIRQ